MSSVVEMLETAYAESDWDLVESAMIDLKNNGDEKTVALGKLFTKYVCHVMDSGGCSFLDAAFMGGGVPCPIRPYVVNFSLIELGLMRSMAAKVVETRG